MGFGEKLFEETGKVSGFKITKMHPLEGVTMEVSFASEIKGIGKVPNGKNMGSGQTTQYPTGTVDAKYQGVFTTEQGDQFMWWAYEKSGVVEDGKTRGLVTVTGVTSSQKLAWINKTVIAIETEFDPAAQQFRGTAYEWK